MRAMKTRAVRSGHPAGVALLGATLAVLASAPAPASAQEAAEVTYSRDIAPILLEKCVGCHREGDIAPFSLDTYDAVRQRGRAIADVTARRYMPPWKPVAVYDDGRRVYVEFPRGIVQGEMPPIFVIGADGEAQIANSRIYQNILIVDRLFGAAELRLGGGKSQQTVRIVRTDGRPS